MTNCRELLVTNQGDGNWKIIGAVVGHSRAKPWPESERLIDLPERELVRSILKYAHLHTFFVFAVTSALGSSRQGWDYVMLAEVKREWLNLQRGMQPGDVDVIIVPYRENTFHFDKVAAIEVKRLAIRTGKLGKNTDRYGVTQAQGLLRDGFPYVGILHVIVSEPDPGFDKQELQRAVFIGDGDRVTPLEPNLVDTTGMRAAQIQVRRLLSRDCDPNIGIHTVGLQLNASDDNNGITFFPETIRPAQLNPRMSTDLARHLSSFLKEMKPHMDVRTD